MSMNRYQILGLQIVAIAVLALAFEFSGIQKSVFAQADTQSPSDDALTTGIDASLTETPEMGTPGSVTTDADLDNYIQTVLAFDNRISTIKTTASTVSVSGSGEPAKVLGLVATTIPVTLTADAAGNVTVTHPQPASFLVRPESDEALQADAEAHISIYVASRNVTPQIKAQIISGLKEAVDESR